MMTWWLVLIVVVGIPLLMAMGCLVVLVLSSQECDNPWEDEGEDE